MNHPLTTSKCLAELQHEALEFRKHGAICALEEGIYKSDSVIPADLKEDLRRACAPLEDVYPCYQDWHPGSNGKVLDLVHPSLFPLVYGRSKILPNSDISVEDCMRSAGKGVVVPLPSKYPVADLDPHGNIVYSFYSKKYQWLPCNVSFGDDTEQVRFESLFRPFADAH